MVNHIVKRSGILLLIILSACTAEKPEKLSGNLKMKLVLKTAGNPAVSYDLRTEEKPGDSRLVADTVLPLEVRLTVENSENSTLITLNLKAKEACNVNLSGCYTPEDLSYSNSEFLMPGFWYHRNARSPENAPNIRRGSSWMVREDRLSAPLTAIFDSLSGKAHLILRHDLPRHDALMPYEYGDIILNSITDLGGTGFGEDHEKACLLFSYPYTEKPYTYRRKLWLAPESMAFLAMKAGENKVLAWEIHGFNADSYSEFMEDTWSFAFSRLRPQPLPTNLPDSVIKHTLALYFRDSYTECDGLKSSSGVELGIDRCEKRGIFEVGFVGRVLINAFNALQYGYETGDSALVHIGRNILGSYEQGGFTHGGLLREWVDCRNGHEADIFSLRRQSEGLTAIIHYLDYERKNGRLHPVLEEKCRTLIGNLLQLQREDNSFPRKFDDDFAVTDESGGSTPTIIPALVLASAYFHQPELLGVAQKTAVFLDREIVAKADYFSSTLDANCEDKEAALYTLNSYYYLWLASDDSLKDRYLQQARKVSFFALSWYYLWDVPFAPGQMLGDLGFKTRGWGNVSVENNHVDVYVFEFTEVLKWLSEQTGDKRYEEMATVITSSMRDQLLPRTGYLCGIAKPGYHPEVVQHTNWDYGKNGKGYYNDIFAPGWVVSSLWELLTPGRTREIILSNAKR